MIAKDAMQMPLTHGPHRHARSRGIGERNEKLTLGSPGNPERQRMAQDDVKILFFFRGKRKQRSLILNLCHFDDIRIDTVCYWLETTAVASETGLFARFALRATVAVDTLGVVALQPKAAGSHASNSRQNMKLLPS